MLHTTVAVLIIVWMLGLATDFTMGSFIHILYAVAVALLVVSLSREVSINQKLRHVSRSRGPKQDRTLTEARAVNGPADTTTDYAMRYHFDATVMTKERQSIEVLKDRKVPNRHPLEINLKCR